MNTKLIIALGATVLALTGCTTAKVLYSTSDTIGVRYDDTGIDRADGKAMAMIAAHCPDGFEITNRTSAKGRQATVDARCK